MAKVLDANGNTKTISSFTASSTDTLTNKTFDANGTGNSLSNVDVADLANGTDGELITWDASGNPATVSVGTSGQVLTSNGAGAAPTFQAASGGEWELITTTTASSSATVEFTDLSSTYVVYKIICTELTPASDAVSLLFRTSTDNGSTFDSGASDYAYAYSIVASDSAATLYGVSNGATSMVVGNILGTGTGEQGYFEATLFRPSATKRTHAFFLVTQFDSNGNERTTNGSGARLEEAAVDAIQFLFVSGNIASGDFRLYGIRAS